MSTTDYVTIPSVSSLPDTAVLVPSSYFSSILRREIAVHSTITQRCLLHDAIPLYQSESLCVLSPVLGAQAMMLCAETLKASGVKRLVLFGFAGGIAFHQLTPAPGDIVLAEGAHCETGFSAICSSPKHIPALNSELKNTIAQALRASEVGTLHRGDIWSTSIPFQENAEKAKFHAAQNAIAVDMEYAPLLQFATEHDVELAAVLIISDILDEAHHSHFSKVKNSGIIADVSRAILSTLL